MKIIHTSNVHLGKSFSGHSTAGDKLRAAIKRAFSQVIDLSLAEKADMVIFAGDTFDSVDVSQNLLKFFLSEIRRLEKIPVFLLPGERDYYQKGSFWEEWEITPAVDNLHMLTNTERPYIDLPRLSTTVYGYPILAESSLDNPAERLRKFGKSKYHIAVLYGNLVHDTSQAGHNYPFHPDDLMAGGFSYAALGGQKTFRDFSSIGIKAAYCGSPEIITPVQIEEAGTVAVVELDESQITVEPRRVGNLCWREMHISMETVANPDDLKSQIKEMAGPDVFLRVTLEGLTLFESGLNLGQLHKELYNGFMHLEFVDHTRVLPDNISAVKVQEKTILGQYLKVMVDKLNDAEGTYRIDLEESLKVGYTLLSGKELW